MMISYIFLILVSGATYIVGVRYFDGIAAMAWALALGGFASFIYSVIFIKNQFLINIFEQKKVLFTLLSIFVGYLTTLFSDIGAIEKSLIYIMYFVFLTFIFKINVLKLLKRK
jgi:hypothetical protein